MHSRKDAMIGSRARRLVSTTLVAVSSVALLLALAPVAIAQTSGTITVSGQVNAAVKITSGGAATLTGNSGGGVTTQSAADALLATVVDFGDVGPGNTNNYVCFTQPLYLRANAASTVSGAVTAESFGGGFGDITKSDIGLGFQNLAAGGPNADISTTTVTAAYSSDPCAAAKTGDGVPMFSASLGGLATSTPGTMLIRSTGPISLRGNFNSANNEADVDVRLAVAPQAFRVGAFSATLRLTMTTP